MPRGGGQDGQGSGLITRRCVGSSPTRPTSGLRRSLSARVDAVLQAVSRGLGYFWIVFAADVFEAVV